MPSHDPVTAGRLRHPAELLLLLGLAFFLPLYEAPKNLLWLAWVIAWAVNRWREREWGGPCDAWDALLLAWIASAYLVAAFSGVKANEWLGANDVLRYGSAALLLRRSRPTARELGLLAMALLAGCLAGLAWGGWRHWVTHARPYLELNSVGHVNHSAPYIAMCCGLAASIAVFAWKDLTAGLRVAAAGSAALIGAARVATASRAALGALLVVPLVLAAGSWRRSKWPALLLGAAMAVAAVMAVALDADVVRKQQRLLEKGDVTNARIAIWRRAVVAWEIHPWFGVGMDNYGKVGEEAIRRRVEADGKTYRPEDYVGPNHAHSLYFNTLAERGIVGSGVFLAVLLAWAGALWRFRPDRGTPAVEASAWGAAASAWVVTTVSGIGNTSFHHEIALLGALLLGGWLALRKVAPR